MNGEQAISTLEITPDERTFATLAHALQLAGWWIAPLVIFFVKQNSRFVRFHALQALLWQICVVILWIGVMMIWVGAIFSFMLHQPMTPHTPPPTPPPAFFIAFPLIWLGAMGSWVITLLLSIIYAVKAGRGEWARYPVLGNLALRILKL